MAEGSIERSAFAAEKVLEEQGIAIDREISLRRMIRAGLRRGGGGGGAHRRRRASVFLRAAGDLRAGHPSVFFRNVGFHRATNLPRRSPLETERHDATT